MSQSTTEGRVPLLLEAWTSFVQKRAWATVLVCLSLAVASAGYAFLHLGFKTSRTDLVHPEDEYVRNWDRYAHEFGGESDIIIAVAGGDRSTKISAVQTIARELESFPDHLTRLCYRIDTRQLRAKGLYQLSTSELASIEAKLRSMSPLLTNPDAPLSLAAMAHGGLAATQATEIPPGEASLSAMARLWRSLADSLDNAQVYRSPWADPAFENLGARLREIPEYFFSKDGQIAFLRVMPKESSTDFVRGKEPVRIVRDVLARVRLVFPDLELGLTGIPVLETDEMAAAQKGSQASTLVSVVGVLFIFVVAFRAIRHPLYAMGSLLVAACWTLGLVALVIGHLNILSVSFIVTLIGLGIDYGIVWITHFERRRAEGWSAIEANLDTSRVMGPGTLVGAATTVLAFLTTMVTGFLGLRELGLVAAMGISCCLLAMFTMLPALLAIASAPPTLRRERASEKRFFTCDVFLYWPRFTAAIVLLAATAAMIGMHRLKYDFNLLNLQAEGLESVDWERRLIERTGTSGWYALTMANSAEEARRLSKEFAQLPTVGQVVEIASFIPADQAEKQPAIDRIADLLRDISVPQQVSSATRPAALLATLAALTRIEATGASEILVERVIQSARDVVDRLNALSAEEQDRRLARYEKRWLDDLSRMVNGLSEVATAEPVTASDLPDSLVARFYNPHGKWAIQVFARGSVWDMQPLKQFREDLAAIDPRITGKPISTLYSLEQMTDGFQMSGLLAAAAIALAVWLDFRCFRMTIWSLVPLMVGAGSMFGLMGWLSIPLNPANMIALPLILGIGVDYGVHVVHDFRRCKGLYRPDGQLLRALVLNSLTTVVSFCSLVLAPHRGMVSIGLSLALGVGCCTLAAIVLLPALLRAGSAQPRNDEQENEEPEIFRMRRAA